MPHNVSVTYCVTDLETDGPQPGRHSMLRLASVAVDAMGRRLGAFSVNLEPLPGHEADPDTMDWWKSRPAAWMAAREAPRRAQAAIETFATWVGGWKEAVFVGYPLSFDGAWIDWYMRRFLGLPLLRPPRQRPTLFQGGGLDLPSFLMGKTGATYKQAAAKHFPDAWLGDTLHNHVALDDAEGYAHLLAELLRTPPHHRLAVTGGQ